MAAQGGLDMQRFALTVVMTGVLGLAAYTFSGAQPPARGPGGHRPWGGPGGGRGDIALLRGADLTEDQKAAIKAIREAEQASGQGPSVEGRLRRELQAEAFADTPDPQKIASLQQQLAESQTARLARQIATDQKIAQVLTAEQRARIRERLAQAPFERRGARPQGQGARRE
jgi:Spy/CpxP family protein refolding chaperone